MRARPLQLLGQAMAYAMFAVVIGYLATSPAYTHLDPGLALIKLSFSHAGRHKGECRQRTPEELAKLSPNMRRPLDCPRGRLPLQVELVLDGEPLYRGELPPSGLAGDGAAMAYRKFPVAPGRHYLVARLRDSDRSAGYDYEKEAEITLNPRQNFVIDFRPALGGFLFL
jgi:hypothetical protein